MKEKNALRVRKLMTKKRVERTEQLIVEYGTIVLQYEADLISEEQARNKMNELFKNGIKRKLIVEQNVQEIMNVMVNDRDTFKYLKEKHGDQ